HDVVAGVAQPAGDFPPDTRCTAGHQSAHLGGPINSTSTPSGAVITDIGTVVPPGAGTLMRRTPSVKPKAARPDSVASTCRCRESRKNPCRGAGAGVGASRGASHTRG